MPKGILGAHDSPGCLARLLARYIQSLEAWRTFSEGMVVLFRVPEFQASKGGRSFHTSAHWTRESLCEKGTTRLTLFSHLFSRTKR